MKNSYFPLLTIISSSIIIITGIFCENKDAVIAGTTISGIAGTAYQSKLEGSEDEKNLQNKMRKNKGTSSDLEGDFIE